MTPKELENAVMQNKIDLIAQARQEGVDPNQYTLSGNSLLHTALLSCTDAINDTVKELLKFKNLEIDKPNLSFSISPLQSVLGDNKYSIAKSLIDAGANINVKDSVGNNLLMSAIMRQETNKIYFLLNNGIDTNVENKDGTTTFFYAMKLDMIPLAKKLIERGSDPFHVSANGNCVAVHLAINYSQEKTLLICEEAEKRDKLIDLKEQVDKIYKMYIKEQSENYSPQKEIGFNNLKEVRSMVNSFIINKSLHQNLDINKPLKTKKI